MKLQAVCRGGSFAVESVAAFAWNGWQASSGISGNLGLEYACSLCDSLRSPNLEQATIGRLLIRSRIRWHQNFRQKSLWVGSTVNSWIRCEDINDLIGVRFPDTRYLTVAAELRERKIRSIRVKSRLGATIKCPIAGHPTPNSLVPRIGVNRS